MFSKLVGGPEDRCELIEATIRGIKSCDPFPLDPGFGQAIAQRPFSLNVVPIHGAIQT